MINFKKYLEEASTNYVIKHKKTKQVLNTHSDYATAKDEHEGLGKDKVHYGVYKQTKKDAALKHRNQGTMMKEGKRGLWDNIHAKRKRIKAGSGERMRKPGSKGAPSDQDFKNSQKEAIELDELSKKTLGSYVKKASKQVGDLDRSSHELMAKGFDSKDRKTASAYMKASDKKYKKLGNRHKGISKAVDKITK